MTKVLTFKVEIEGLESKIWRCIEITDRRTVADLAYTILATFESLAYHLYTIKYKETVYDCWVAIQDDYSEIPPINAVITKLGNIGLKENDILVMEYDTGTPTVFNITYLCSRDFERRNGMHYPYIVDGMGLGMIDDITNDELKEIINSIDKTGKSNYYALCIDGRNSKLYDYRNFYLKENNLYVRRYLSKIKHSYEQEYE